MSLEALREAVGEGYVYLASPYSGYHGGLDEAHRRVCRAAGYLIGSGIPTFCPIAHSHPVSCHGDVPALDHAIWLPADTPLMRGASALCIYRLKGWGESLGVMHELRDFETRGLPIFSMSTCFDVLEHAGPAKGEEVL